MKKILVLLLGTVLLLAACGGSGDVETAEVEATAVTQTTSTTQVATQLSSDYADALSVQGQLALGTVQLQSGDLAVDQAQAETLLPFWQALNSLVQSGTAADSEINAVLKQIQSNMTSEQISAIADLHLTQESMSDLAGAGGLRGNGGGGLRPNGGIPGGRQGGGGLPGEGPGGGDPGAIETRQAEFASGGAEFFEGILTTMVVRTLEAQASGIEPADRINPYQEAVNVVSDATGLSVEQVQAQTATGKTLAEIVMENDGDLTEISAVLIEKFSNSDFLGDQDMETAVADFLNNSFERRADSGNNDN